MKKTIKTIFIILSVVLLLLLATTLYFFFAYQNLSASAYTIHAEIEEPLCIVHLSDLHNKEYGENNVELVELVAAQQPDLIFMSGDMLNRDDPNVEIVSNLIKALTSIAPVYFGYGNHEYTWEKNFSENLREIFTEAGATVVNNDYIDVEVNGQALRIGGYMGYYRKPGMFKVSDEQRATEFAFADIFEDTERLKLLINHIPTQWVDWNYVDKHPVGIVFSGHYHGGAIRIPFLDQGLYAPYVGWLPSFTKGIYTGEKATCVLSAGLGNEHHVPRINNPPEIVVVDLVPEK